MTDEAKAARDEGMALWGAFWAKVDRSGECWLWTASVTHDGYGRIRVPKTRRMALAHRLAYEDFYGPIPSGKAHIDHLCRTKRCVRPSHLEAVTQTENAHRTRLETCARGHTDWRPRGSTRRRCRTCATENNRAARIRKRAERQDTHV